MTTYHLDNKMLNRLFNDIIDEGWFADTLSAQFQGTVNLYDMEPQREPRHYLKNISKHEEVEHLFSSLKKLYYNQSVQGNTETKELEHFVKQQYVKGKQESPETGKNQKMIEGQANDNDIFIRPAVLAGLPARED